MRNLGNVRKGKDVCRVLAVLVVFMASICLMSCGGDDDSDSGSSSSMTAADLTADGYFDGMLYYQITSNSPNEVTVAKASKSLTKVEIPAAVIIEGEKYKCSTIGSWAFEGCMNIETVIIPTSVTRISSHAFALSGITSLSIPTSITKIESVTFEQCSRLVSIEIPSSVTEIEYSAFYYCTALKSISFPSSIKKIGDMALDGCSSLTAIHCSWTTPPALDSPINQDGVYSKATLYVPRGYASSYINILPWSLFKSIREE